MQESNMQEIPIQELLSALKSAYAGKLLTEETDKAPYLTDWRKRYHGRALAVLLPQSAEELAPAVAWAYANNVALVPQGGNTGLAGGATPDMQGRTLVVSLTRMNQVRAIDTVNNTITVEAGCILQHVQEAADKVDRLFPLSLAAEGTCTIGGNLSTNAGGVQVLRYGNARELCLGLEVINAQGEVWNGLRGLRKDNTGYDLRDLFIGAEGTLGIVTAATLKLFPKPKGQATAVVAVDSPELALNLLGLAQSQLDARLTAFELFSEFCLELVLRHYPDCKRPVAQPSPYYVLLECSDALSEASAQSQIEHLLESALQAGLISDAAVATSSQQSKQLWALRENISEAQAAEGKNIKHDISVPISSIAHFIRLTNAELQDSFPDIRMVVFGHLGDGNLHYNVSPALAKTGQQHEDAFLALQPEINRITHDAVHAFHGSISAEHGLGQLRRDESQRYKSEIEMTMMRAIKTALDPKGLLNPGKVLSV
jgi:FAD/FMN-containing dehydrogenase